LSAADSKSSADGILKPEASHASRSRRTRRVFEALVSAAFSKGVLLVSNVLTIPIVIRYLGGASFGVWSTITTVLTMLLALDLGIANALTNLISEAYAHDDRMRASVYTTTALSVTVLIAVVIGCSAWLLWPYISFDKLLRLPAGIDGSLVASGAAIALAIFLVDLPARLAVKVLGGYQELRTANLFAVVGSAGNLVTIVVLVHIGAGLPALVAGSSAALVGSDLLCLLWLLYIHKPWLRPMVSHVQRAAAVRMMRNGAEFFLLQVAGLVAFNSDNLVITHYLGPVEVAKYSVTWRLIGYATVIQTLILPALWPAFAEAFARGDSDWMRRTFWRVMWITMATVTGCVLVFAVCGRTIIRLWATVAAVPDQPLILLMCVWVLISTFMSNTAIVLAATGNTRVQAWLSVVSAALNLALTVWWVQYLGAIGVILGTIVSFLIVLIVPQSILAWNVLYGHGLAKASR
jgi:O-antigen/teichoic acid export membrane protein